MNALAIAALVLGAAFATPAYAQDKPADNMQILMEKLKADKKLLVAENLQLTESEAKAFWPVYESYQKDLDKINERLGKVINDYGANYQSLTDDVADKLTTEAVAIEVDRTKLMQSYLPKLKKALPARKAARYYQLESKIRAVLNFQLAANIPLAK
ncbi:MAG: hypothetical protein ACRD3R_05285 [Terriglobales bacterium]